MGSKKSPSSTVRKTASARSSRSARTPGVAGSAAAGKNKLSTDLIFAIEQQRSALRTAVTLLTSLDALMQLMEDGGTDILNDQDPVDSLVLQSRELLSPVEIVRMAIATLHRAFSELESDHLEKAANAPLR